ncbi:hypothetical protein [Micromonospora siamensis]|uniref:Uncharacterized protein n=1 Tax=Micromonospora siamensis TaxID=299152 RepID=A0A1C5GMV9_9ACTN|nr:hypothetical protein [Micromonospora siamensis]SCG35140.1 hypothetical protein GA0074704_0181 [Micromonospora siamensis]
MTTDATRTPFGTDGARAARTRRVVATAGRNLGYAATLLPVALTALAGRHHGAATRWWRLRAWLTRDTESARREPGRWAVTGHALASLLLGAAALVPLGVVLLMLLRGVLYGVVDPGHGSDRAGRALLVVAWTRQI